MQNLLDMRPLRLREYRMHESKGDGNVTVLVPKFGTGKIGRWFGRRVKNPDYLVRLDEFGTFVWHQCDGARQVREIAASLEQQFGEKVHPAQERLTLFFRQMERSRLIAFREVVGNDRAATTVSSSL